MRSKPGVARTDRSMHVVFFGTVIVLAGTIVGSMLAGTPVLPRASLVPGTHVRTPQGTGFQVLFGFLAQDSLLWYGCVLSAPAFYFLARRLPTNGKRWPVTVLLFLAAAVCAALLLGAITYIVMFPGPEKPPLQLFLIQQTSSQFMAFLGVAALAEAFELYQRHHASQLEASRLRTLLLEARLEALSAQLQPHFLFNTLQGISTLMHRDVSAADAMLGGLSDLLRATLNRQAAEIPLHEELALVERYTTIVQLRFGERVRIGTDIDPAARDGLVPFFILQPLVENAIEHGISRSGGGGHVEIEARRTGDAMQIVVADDGAEPLDVTARAQSGIGLENTRQRLRELYGENQSVELKHVAGIGTTVSLVFPYRVPTA